MVAPAANSQKMPKSANEKDDFMVAFLSFFQSLRFHMGVGIKPAIVIHIISLL
jgi:hypothetical protein